jgi:hypothetical protein
MMAKESIRAAHRQGLHGCLRASCACASGSPEELHRAPAPKSDTAGDARRVVDDPDVRWHVDGKLARVAAADIEHVAARQVSHGVYHLAHAPVPALPSLS